MVVIATWIGAKEPGALTLGAQHYVPKGQGLLGNFVLCDGDR